MAPQSTAMDIFIFAYASFFATHMAAHCNEWIDVKQTQTRVHNHTGHEYTVTVIWALNTLNIWDTIPHPPSSDPYPRVQGPV